MFTPLRALHPGSSIPHILRYEFCRRLARLVIAILYRPIAHDVRNVPKTGPCLLVSNHQSYFDPPLISSYVTHRHTDFIARQGLFKSRLFGWIISALNSIPIAENGSDTAGIREVLKRLDQGRCVLIFPEGSRTEDGAIGEFKRGAELLLKKAKCPVVPVAIEGVYDAYPRGAKHIKIRGCRIAVRYGKPIPPEELLNKDAELRPLDRIKSWIDAARLELREELRNKTRGAYPPAGPGDKPV